MSEALVSVTAAIGNANGIEIVSITEDQINLLFEKAFLEERTILDNEPLEDYWWAVASTIYNKSD